MEQALLKYVKAFQKLKRDHSFGGAPHKPILLLSIIQAFEKKLFSDNKIYIIPELVALFKSNWNILVKTNHSPSFALPFFHLKSEGFWKLATKLGMEIVLTSSHSVKSFKSLNETIDHAEILSDLTFLLLENESRDILKLTLIEKYFPNRTINFIEANENKYWNQLTTEMLEDSAITYSNKIAQLKENLDKENYEEEIYLRGGIFKREIPKIYNYTCCISELRIDASKNVSMIDACHIMPFSEGYNDTITNGISLCPNLHRAFDRYLISIDNEYRVIVSNKFIENNNVYSMKQFEGKKILLPDNAKYFPDKDLIGWHRERFMNGE